MDPFRETLAQRYERVAAQQRKSLIVSADDFRVDEFGVYHHEGDMGLIAWRMAARVFTELAPTVDRIVALTGAPGAGKSTWIANNREDGVLYLDLTLSRRRSRREVCEIVHGLGREISCVFIHPKVDVCLAQNRSRGRQVPDNQIARAHHRLTVCPPQTDEGWSRVMVVGDGLEADSGLEGDGLDRVGPDL